MSNYKIILSKELKPGDKIIHNYTKFVIVDCGRGAGAGSFDFGEYFWIRATPIGVKSTNHLIQSFWSFQECPVIKILD